MTTNGDGITKWVNPKTIITTMLIALGGWVWSTNQKIERVLTKIEEHQDIDDTLSKHWKILSWTKDRINEERAARGEPIVGWPDLGG